MILTAMLGACGSGNDPTPVAAGVSGKFRAVNGIADSPTSTTNSAAPGADVALDGQQDPRLQDLPFASGSNLRTYAVGTDTVTFSVRNSGNATVVASLAGTPIDLGKLTTVYAAGLVNNGTQTAFFIQTPMASTTTSATGLLTVHDAAAAGPVSLYVSAPGDAFPGGATPVNLGFKGSSLQSETGDRTYRFRITAQGQPGNVLFDSGPNGVYFYPGVQYQLALLDNPQSEGGSTLYLLLVSDAGDPGDKLVNGMN